MKMISTIDPDKAFQVSMLFRKPSSKLRDLLVDIDAMKMIRENDPEFSELYVSFLISVLTGTLTKLLITL